MDFTKSGAARYRLTPLRRDLKDVSDLEAIQSEIREGLLGTLPEQLKDFSALENIQKEIRYSSENSRTSASLITSQNANRFRISEQNVHQSISHQKLSTFISNPITDKKIFGTDFFSDQQEQQKKLEILNQSKNSKNFLKNYLKKKDSGKKDKKYYKCSEIVGGAKHDEKSSKHISNALYKDTKCAEVMHRYNTAKKPTESFRTMAAELSKIVDFNVSRYQASYQFTLYQQNLNKCNPQSTEKAKTKPEQKSAVKLVQSKIPFYKKKMGSPQQSDSPKLADVLKQLHELQKQTNGIAQEQKKLHEFIFQNFKRKDNKEDVMNPKSEGFNDVMSVNSENALDDVLSQTSVKFSDDGKSEKSPIKSFINQNSIDDEKMSWKSEKSLNSDHVSSFDSSKPQSYDESSAKKDEKAASLESPLPDEKQHKKVNFNSSMQSDLETSDKENSSVDFENEKMVVQVNKKGQELTEYSIRKNSKLKPMVVVNRNNMWYSYTVKGRGLTSQRYECNLCPRHSYFKSKGIMKNGKFWVHPKHSPLCKPMTKEEFEVLQINRDIREDISKGYHIQDSYMVGYKKALEQGLEKDLPTIENVSKSLDRWKAKTYPASVKGKVAMEHKVLLNGKTFLLFEDQVVSVFMSDEAAVTMADCRILVADPTFKTSPQGFMQTLYIHGLVETENGAEWRPLLMAPIDSKKEEDYLKVVNAIKKRWNELGVKPKFERFHTDYEKALFNAFAELGGVEKMYGCIFHYNKAVLKSVKDVGLFGYYLAKKGNKIPEYKVIKKWVRTIMALPMLPKEDIPVLAKELLNIPQPPPDCKVKWPTTEMQKLKSYIETEWLAIFEEKDNNKWSFFGLGRTKNTNAGEGFHSGLNKTMPKKPKYKVFLELQKNRFSTNDTRIHQLKHKTVKSKCISKKYKNIAERIQKLEAKLEQRKTQHHAPDSYVRILRRHCEAVSHLLHEVRNKSLQTKKNKKGPSKSYNKVSEYDESDFLFSGTSEEEKSDDENDGENDTLKNQKKENETESSDERESEESEDEDSEESEYEDTDSNCSKVSEEGIDGETVSNSKENDSKKNTDKENENGNNIKESKSEKIESEVKNSMKALKSLEKTKMGKRLSDAFKKVISEKNNSKAIKREKNDDANSADKSFQKNCKESKKENEQKPEERRALEVPPFVPPSLEEIQAALKTLGIPEEHAARSPLLKAKRGTLVFSNLKIFNVRGDGNCGYRALSYLLTGSQEFHWQIRMKVMEYVVQNRLKIFMPDDVYTNYVNSYNKLVTYSKPRAVQRRHWASDNDFLGFAKLTNINVYIHNPPDKKYNYSRCVPLIKDGKWNRADSGLFIDWVNGNHFVPIVNV